MKIPVKIAAYSGKPHENTRRIALSSIREEFRIERDYTLRCTRKSIYDFNCRPRRTCGDGELAPPSSAPQHAVDDDRDKCMQQRGTHRTPHDAPISTRRGIRDHFHKFGRAFTVTGAEKRPIKSG